MAVEIKSGDYCIYYEGFITDEIVNKCKADKIHPDKGCKGGNCQCRYYGVLKITEYKS